MSISSWTNQEREKRPPLWDYFSGELGSWGELSEGSERQPLGSSGPRKKDMTPQLSCASSTVPLSPLMAGIVPYPARAHAALRTFTRYGSAPREKLRPSCISVR